MKYLPILLSVFFLSSASSGDHGKLKYFKADPAKGYDFPFYLFIPDHLPHGDTTRLVVEPNNTGIVSDRLSVHRKKARRTASLDYYIGNYVATRLNCPLLVPVFPRPASQNKIYTHSLDRDVMLEKGTPLERIDLQLLAMVKEAGAYLSAKEIPIRDRILMTGFSASGTFVNRFTLLHPDRVAAAAAGGLNGLLALPLEELEDIPLEYPLGTYDFEKLVGKPFDPEGFRQTPQYLFMGAEDTNDAIPYADGYDEVEREKIYMLLGEEMQPARWDRCAGIYRNQEVDAVIRTIPGLGHAHPDSIKNNIVQFFIENILVMEKNTYPGSQPGPGQPELITASDLQQLPQPVADWLEKSGVMGTPHIHSVWLSQASEMRMSPEKERWNRAISKQVFNADDPAFTWQVKMKMGPVNVIRGKDEFLQGIGKMNIRLFGLIPVVNESGPMIDEGSIQRFLGEIAWFPQAALKPYITWEQVDAHTAKAVIESHGTRGEGTFYFNSEGDFIRFTALRYKGNDANAERKEWVITAHAYTSFSGIRVPCRLEATWKLEEGDWTWLKMEVKEIRYNGSDQIK